MAEPPIVEFIIAHDWQWVPYQDVGASINGPIPYNKCGLQIPTGEVWRNGSNWDEMITWLKVFLQMLPTQQMQYIYKQLFLLESSCV